MTKQKIIPFFIPAEIWSSKSMAIIEAVQELSVWKIGTSFEDIQWFITSLCLIHIIKWSTSQPFNNDFFYVLSTFKFHLYHIRLKMAIDNEFRNNSVLIMLVDLHALNFKLENVFLSKCKWMVCAPLITITYKLNAPEKNSIDNSQLDMYCIVDW